MSLDHNLWHNLPPVLFNNILKFLPSESVFKFRSVCKDWREILTNQRFLEARLGSSHRSTFCVVNASCAEERFAVYNVGTTDWHYLPYIGFLPEDFFKQATSIKGTTTRAAAAGVLLLEVHPELPDWTDCSRFLEGKYLLLVNPANKSYRKLPALEDPDDGERKFYLVGMDFEGHTGAIKVLARSTVFHYAVPGEASSGSSDFHVYDSTANSWEKICESWITLGPEWYSSRLDYVRDLDNAVLHGGFWCYLTYDSPEEPIFSRTIDPQIYKMKSGFAELFQAPLPLPSEDGMMMDFFRLFVCQGKLILAGSVKTVALKELRSFLFWQLDDQGSKWLEYLNMPDSLVTRLGSSRRSEPDLDCSMDDNHIYFCVSNPYGKECMSTKIFIYSISRGSFSTVKSDMELPRSPCEKYWQAPYSRVVGKKPRKYFIFKPNLNIIL